jgi:hypothetical protein
MIQKRTSVVVKNWLFNNGGYSPDTGLVQLKIYGDINRRVESHFAHTVEELKQVSTEEWNNASALMLSNLVASICMAKRCKAIVDYFVKLLLTIMDIKQNIKSVKKNLLIYFVQRCTLYKCCHILQGLTKLVFS